MADALHEAVARHAKRMRKLLRDAARGDAEAVHDTRTAIRRVREGLGVMRATVFEDRPLSKMQSRLREVLSALGATRDDDVLLADIDAWCSFHEDERSPLAELRALADRCRAASARAMKRELRRGRTRDTVRAVTRFFRGAPHAVAYPRAKKNAAVPTLVRHFVASQTWRGYEEVLAYESMPAEVAVIHRVRSACRRLRFRLDLFDGALPREASRVAELLHHSQTRLGELHDHAVAVERVDQWLARGRVARTAAIDAYLDRHREALREMRRLFTSEWRAVTGPVFRAALAHALCGTEAVEPVSFVLQ